MENKAKERVSTVKEAIVKRLAKTENKWRERKKSTARNTAISIARNRVQTLMTSYSQQIVEALSRPSSFSKK